MEKELFMKELINVVVPVYNAEKFMDRCLQSLTQQTYDNLNIILVDDCSSDNSARKCDEWAIKDSRITVYKEKVNKGPANARNTALKQIDFSKGYIAFVDIDDYIHPQYFEKMHEMLKRTEVDIVWVDVINTHEAIGYKFDESSFEKYEENIYSSKEVLLREDWRTMYSMTWGKLYKAALWSEVRFPDNCRYFEDGATVFKALYQADKILKTNIKLYYYYYSPNSETRSNMSEAKCRCGLMTCTEKIDFYSEKAEIDLLEMAYVGYVNIILKNIVRSRFCENPREFKKEMKALYRANYKRVIRNKNLSMIQRFKYIIYRICPNIQELYIKVKLKIKR